jgi:hypothetical protein
LLSLPADRQLEFAARREERNARPDLRVLALPRWYISEPN